MNLVLSHVDYTITEYDVIKQSERDVITFTNKALAEKYLKTLNKQYMVYGIKHTQVFKRGE